MLESRRGTKLKVLVADRHRMMAEALGRIIEAHGSVAATVCGAEELLEVGPKVAPDVAVVDLALSPDCGVVSQLHAACPDARIIVLADREGVETEGMVKALASGAVGAIYKESSIENLAKALLTSTRSSPVVPEDAAGLLLGSYVDALSEKRERDLATIEALAAAVEARDSATGEHLKRVTDLATSCLEQIDPELARNEEVAYGFMLHDVGKVGIPDAVLNKPGPLDDGEWQTMRRHPEIGLRIVEPIGFSNNATDVILHHHEHWAGDGYPNRLRRDEIPITARAFAVADAYDAITSTRPYRKALDSEAALELIGAEAGGRFDPDVVDTFINLVED